MKVQNRYTSPIALPGGQIIPPGKVVAVQNWDKLTSVPIIKTWLKAGVLIAIGDEPGGPAAQEVRAARNPIRPNDLTVKSVLEMATNGTPFQTFKAAAAQVLGEEVPARKAEIVKVLKTKV